MIEWIPHAYNLVILGLAGLLDVRSREVDPRFWLLAIALGLPVTLWVNVENLRVLVVYQLLSLVVVIVAYAMYRTCMIGGADVLAFLTITLIAPLIPGSLVPTLYLAILYATIPGVAYQLYSAYLACGGLKLGCMMRFRFKVKARLIVEDPRFRWWLVEGGGECSIEGDPKQLAVKASGGNLESYITASPGHPYVAHLAVGYAIALILGDKPIVNLILELAQLT